VELHSPYENGALYATHLIIAGIVNPDNDHELWIAPEQLAKRCHCSVRTLRRHLERMVADEMLELAERGGGRGKVTKYRFLMPENKQCQNGTVSAANSVTTRAETVSPGVSHLLPTKEVTKARDGARADVDPLYGFDHFWGMYPKRNGRRIGRGLCERRWARLSIEDRRAAYRGACNYRADVDAQRTIAKDPDRWLRDRLWEDWQEHVEPVESVALTAHRPEVGYDPDAPDRFAANR
jgi:hypothetical protein